MLALLIVLLGLAADPVFQIADAAAQELLDPTAYVHAVLGADE